MTRRVKVTIEDGVADVRLSRPDKRNGLDLPMFEGLVAAGERVRDDRAVRAVVLSGEGKSFCAGLDFPAFLAMGGEAGQRLLRRPEGTPANIAQRVAWIWREVPVPVVAAIHGHAYGGGLQIALGADIRIVAPDAKLSVMEIRYGLVPDMGMSQTLLRLVRHDVAKELVFTGRIVGGEEAVALGLCTRTSDDPLADATALAREIASKSPHAIRAGKALMEAAVTMDAAASFLLETELQLGLLGSPNQLEAVQASMGGRAPTFADPE